MGQHVLSPPLTELSTTRAVWALECGWSQLEGLAWLKGGDSGPSQSHLDGIRGGRVQHLRTLTVYADNLDHGEHEERQRGHVHLHQDGRQQEHHQDDGEAAWDAQRLGDPDKKEDKEDTEGCEQNIPEGLFTQGSVEGRSEIPGNPYPIPTYN